MINFAGIYMEFQPKIHRYLSHLSGETDATDLTQEVFLKVSQSLDNFRGESSLATWIYRIATNTAYNHTHSSDVKNRRVEISFSTDESVYDIPDTKTPITDQKYIRYEMNTCIRGVIDQLPDNLRTVILLSELEGFANSEIAEMLDLSIDNVKIRLHRARTLLRKSMECQCTLYRDERNELMCDRKPE